MDVFKVVRFHKGEAWSAMWGGSQPDEFVDTRFTFGMNARRGHGNGPLTAFCTLGAAVRFLKYMECGAQKGVEKYGIYKCKARKSRAKKVWLWLEHEYIQPSTAKQKNSVDIHHEIKLRRERIQDPLVQLENDTVLCDWIRPLEELSPIEVFKVTKIIDDQAWSWIKGEYDTSHAAVQYRIGIPTEPVLGNGPLCTFDSLEHALNYMEQRYEDCGPFAIYRCEGYVSKTQKIWYVYEGIRQLGGKLYELEPGTVLCDVVVVQQEINHQAVLDLLHDAGF